MRCLIFALLLTGCFAQKQDSVDSVIERSIDKKEGVDIKIVPIKPEKIV